MPSIDDVYKEVLDLKKEVAEIKRLIDPDCYLTAAERAAVGQAIEEHKAGKTVSLAQIKEELGIDED